MKNDEFEKFKNMLSLKDRRSRFFKKMYKKFLIILGHGKQDNTPKSLFSLFRFAFYFLLIIAFITAWFIYKVPYPDNYKMAVGEWGDFFGGILNPIFTFITFMGLLITIVLQQKELRLTRKEFEDQTNALENQQREMVKQTFDNKFFQMLNSFNKLVASLEFGSKSGKDVFQPLVDKLFPFIFEEHSHSKRTDIEEFQGFLDSYQKFNDEEQVAIVRYYFLNLYQILRYIKDEAPKNVNQKKYANIIRAQLSKYELILLFYNAVGIIKYSRANYLWLVEEYKLLEHFQFGYLGTQGGIRPLGDKYHASPVDKNYIERVASIVLSCYDHNAFGKNEKLKRISRENNSIRETKIFNDLNFAIDDDGHPISSS